MKSFTSIITCWMVLYYLTIVSGQEGKIKGQKETYESSISDILINIKLLIPNYIKIEENIELKGLADVKNLEINGLNEFIIEKVELSNKPALNIIVAYKDLMINGQYFTPGGLKEIVEEGDFNITIPDFRFALSMRLLENQIKFAYRFIKNEELEIEVDGMKLNGKKFQKGFLEKIISSYPFYDSIIEHYFGKQDIKITDYLDQIMMSEGQEQESFTYLIEIDDSSLTFYSEYLLILVSFVATFFGVFFMSRYVTLRNILSRVRANNIPQTPLPQKC